MIRQSGDKGSYQRYKPRSVQKSERPNLLLEEAFSQFNDVDETLPEPTEQEKYPFGFTLTVDSLTKVKPQAQKVTILATMS